MTYQLHSHQHGCHESVPCIHDTRYSVCKTALSCLPSRWGKLVPLLRACVLFYQVVSCIFQVLVPTAMYITGIISNVSCDTSISSRRWCTSRCNSVLTSGGLSTLCTISICSIFLNDQCLSHHRSPAQFLQE